MTALEELKALKLSEAKRKSPNVPEHALQINLYQNYSPEKREKKRIESYLNLKGHRAMIIENRGQRVDKRKTYTDVIGQVKTVGSIEWIGSGMRKGLEDISATINGKTVAIELKRVYKKGKDRQSSDQKEEQTRVESAGGIYLIVSSFEDFLTKYKNFLQSI